MRGSYQPFLSKSEPQSMTIPKIIIPNRDSLEWDRESSRDILRVLSFNVLVENGSVVSPKTLTCEVKPTSRISRHSSHKPLECSVKVWCSIMGRVRGEALISITICPTCSATLCVVGASSIWQSYYWLSINCQDLLVYNMMDAYERGST